MQLIAKKKNIDFNIETIFLDYLKWKFVTAHNI